MKNKIKAYTYKRLRERTDWIYRGKTYNVWNRKKFGLSYQEIRDFKARYNRNQKKLAAEIAIKPKDYEITEEMKINELKYIIARKDSKIKRLEMENELMRDFLSLTERKWSRRLNIKSSLSIRISTA